MSVPAPAPTDNACGISAIASNDVWAVDCPARPADYQTLIEYWDGTS
jgi:hypothetical protein